MCHTCVYFALARSVRDLKWERELELLRVCTGTYSVYVPTYVFVFFSVAYTYAYVCVYVYVCVVESSGDLGAVYALCCLRLCIASERLIDAADGLCLQKMHACLKKSTFLSTDLFLFSFLA